MAAKCDKRILITGINGFIGRHLKAALLEKYSCSQVFGMDKALVGMHSNTDSGIWHLDIENKQDVEGALKEIKPEVIFHLAANIKPSRDLKDLDEMVNTNIIGTVNLLSAVQANNIQLQSFINLGTCEEYGDNAQPFFEQQVPSPVSLYSGTKSAVSMICKMFYNLFHIPVVTVRPSLVYGPGQGDRFFIIQAIKALLENRDFEMTQGEQTRDYIYIDDLIEGLYTISQTRQLAGEAVNLSSGEEYSLKDVVNHIVNLTASQSEIRFGAIPYRQNEVMRFACINQKLMDATQWRPKVSLEEGLKRTIDYVKGALI